MRGGGQPLFNRNSRHLGTRDRVGRFPRDEAWGLISSFAQRFWPALLGVTFLPTIFFLPAFFLLHGAARWVTAGTAFISGPWIVALITIAMSGASDVFMGLDAEGDTADVLRSLRRDGWELANGIKIRGNQDIDHLVVGPAGLLVVETKWSRHRWPLGEDGEPFMRDRLSDAVDDLLSNCEDVITQFGKVINGAPVRPVCVVWSSEDSAGDDPWVESDGALVVRGPDLRSWLRTLTDVALDEHGIDRVWQAVTHHYALRDKDDRRRSYRPRRTIVRVAVDWFLAPYLGFVLAFSGLVALVRLHQSWLDIAGPLVFTAVGVAVRRIAILRRVAGGWIVASVGSELILLAFVLRDVVR